MKFLLHFMELLMGFLMFFTVRTTAGTASVQPTSFPTVLPIAPVDLGIGQYFAIFGGLHVTIPFNSNGTMYGDVGTNGYVQNENSDTAFRILGQTFTNDKITAQVIADITAARINCTNRPNQMTFDANVIRVDVILVPGVYKANDQFYLFAGVVITLDAGGRSDAVWIFNCAGDIYLYGNVVIINLPGYPGDGTVPAPVWWNTVGRFVDFIYLMGTTTVGTFLSDRSYIAAYYTTVLTGSLFTFTGTVVFNSPSVTTIRAKTYPDYFPTRDPTRRPTFAPSITPSVNPSMFPTKMPTKLPTVVPSIVPSKSPTKSPSISPSTVPSVTPSTSPTDTPIAPVDLGIAQYFAVFGGTNVYMQANSSGILNGAVGTNSYDIYDSYGGLFTYHGDIVTYSPTSLQIASDIAAAKSDCLNRTGQIHIETNRFFANLTLTPGVYKVSQYVNLESGISLTLDAEGRSDAAWIFNVPNFVQLNGAVKIINLPGYPGDGSVPSPVWWNVYGDTSVLIQHTISVGVFLAQNSITVTESAKNSFIGALLSIGSVTFASQSQSTSVTAYTYPYIFPTMNPTRVAPTIIITSFLGMGDTNEVTFDVDGTLASESYANLPVGVALDSVGNVYVAEASLSRVVKIDSTTNRLQTVIGNPFFYSGTDGGPATSAKINLVSGLYFNTDTTKLYIPIGQSGVVRYFTINTNIIDLYAGCYINYNYTNSLSVNGDGGHATSAKFQNSFGFWMDTSHNAYITDFGASNIRKVDGTTNIISLFGGTLHGGCGSSNNDGGPATSAQFCLPSGIWGDSNNNYLYIADSGWGIIRRVKLINTITTSLNSNNNLNWPTSLSGDSAGNLYVSDTFNYVILRVPLNTFDSYFVAVGTHGVAHVVGVNSNGDGGPALAAKLMTPYQTALDTTGAIYICEQDGAGHVRVVYNTSVDNSFPSLSPLSAPPSSQPSSLPSGQPTYNVFPETGFVTWRAQNSLPDGNTAICVNSEGDIGLAAQTNGGIYRTVNYGAVWTKFVFQDADYYEMGTNYTVAMCSDSGQYMLISGPSSSYVFFSSDYGVTFEDMGLFPIRDAVLTHEGGHFWANRCNESTISDFHWSHVDGMDYRFITRPEEDQDCNSVILNFDRNGDAYYTDNLNLYVMRISNHSTIWTALENIPIIGEGGTRYLQIDFDLSRTFGNAISADVHYFTVDGCLSWHQSNLPSSTAGAIASFHADKSGQYVAIAVTGDEIYTSVDFGVNFIVDSMGGSENRKLIGGLSWNHLVGSANGVHMLASTSDLSVFGGVRFFAPTSMPSSQPSSQPSQQPVDHPTSQPSTQPTSQPSCQPSDQPSSQPSTQPSDQPTSNPSEIPPCGPGYTYSFTGDGNYLCTACPSGTYTELTALECQSCPAGSRVIGGTTCDECPVNFYSTGANSVSCTPCAAGLANAGTGNRLKSSCVNPQMNFIIAFICLGVCVIGIAVYIVGGRLHRMSFVRKEFLVAKTNEMYTEVLVRIRVMSLVCQNATAQARMTEMLNESLPFWKQIALNVWFGVIICMVFLLFFFAAILRVFFTSLILWRGYSFTIDVPFIDRITSFIESLSFYVHIPYINYVFYPFFYVLNYFASFNISLDSVNVTCLGSQIPMTLLADCFVVGIVVIVIESDMEVFWSTTFGNVHKEFRSLTLQKHFWKSGAITNVLLIAWSVVLQLLPHPRKILQYGLGFVRVMLFFNTNGHAASSTNCDSAFPVGSSGLDTILAVCSTIVAYLLICPLAYLLSQILVPDFRLQKGIVKTEVKIRKKLSQKAHLVCACGNCGLGLQRTYTSQFGGGCYCNWYDHKRQDSPVSCGPKSNFQVVYGCSAMKNCNWAICPDCYHRINEEVKSGKCVLLPQDPHITSSRPTSQNIEDGDSDDDSIGFEEKSHGEQVHSVEQTKLETETPTCSVRTYNGFVYTLKCVMMIAALDWFYIKLTFSFAHYMFDSLVTHLTYMNDMQLESDKSAKKPNLPWFYAVRDKHNDLKAEKEMIEEKWVDIAAAFPSYYRMVLTVQDDLCPKIEHVDVKCSGCGVTHIVGQRYYIPDDPSYNLCETCEHVSQKSSHSSTKTFLHKDNNGHNHNLMSFVGVCASWTIIGQLCSERGRKIWWRVLNNYYVFTLVSFGIWTDEAVRDFEIKSQFEQLESESLKMDNFVVSRMSGTPTAYINRRKMIRSGTSSDIFDRLQLLSALVSTRVVLIQLVPYLTIYSTLAVDISSSPIFIFSPYLEEKVSELFATDLKSKSKDELELMGAIEAEWKLTLLQVYIFCQHSRAICFIQNVVSNLIALSLVFASGNLLHIVIDVAIIWFLLQALMLLIHPFILLHKMVFGDDNKDSKPNFQAVNDCETGFLDDNSPNPSAKENVSGFELVPLHVSSSYELTAVDDVRNTNKDDAKLSNYFEIRGDSDDDDEETDNNSAKQGLELTPLGLGDELRL